MTIQLAQYQLQRPTKIRWRFPEVSDDVLTHIPSKSVRSFVRQTDEILAANQITWELKVLDKAGFGEWLKYYEAKMKENEFDVIASPEWFDRKIQAGQQVWGLLFHQHNQLVGSGIFAVKDTEKATFAFKASERLSLNNEKNSSIGAIIDYLFLREMHQRGIKILSAGQSRNEFGVVNSVGYLDYKLRLGYLPSTGSKAEWSDEVTLNDQDIVLFYAKSTTSTGPAWALYALTPTEWTGSFEVARFATADCPFITLTYQV